VDMEALWLIPAVVLVVGVYFLLRAFFRLNAAMAEVRQGLAELGDMGPRLQRLAGDMSQLAETMEEKRRQ
jgi:cytochrome c-type biogenesis protein CcmH/NrfF